MVEHRDVAPGVVRVTYGDGSRVYVNHTAALVAADGVRVPAMDYVLLDAAVNAAAVVARRAPPMPIWNGM